MQSVSQATILIWATYPSKDGQNEENSISFGANYTNARSDRDNVFKPKSVLFLKLMFFHFKFPII